MAKKFGGASEINGFISIPNTKPKQTLAKKSTSSTTATSRNATTTIKKKLPTTSVSETNQKKNATPQSTSKGGVSTPVASKTTKQKNQTDHTTTTHTVQPSVSRVKPSPPVKGNSTKTTRPSPSVTKTSTIAPSLVNRSKTSRGSTVDAKATTSSTKIKPSGAPDTGLRSKVTSRGIASKPTTLSSSSKTLGRNSRSYTGNLTEPEKPAVSGGKMPPLSRQGTFVKDEEPAVEVNSLAEDFEVYESDFETDSIATDLQKEAEIEEKLFMPDQNSFNQNDVLNRLNEDNAETESKEYEYEDDFEDYESDFEEDTESGFTGTDEESRAATPEPEIKNNKPLEEEKKLDSGNYDLMLKPIKTDLIKQRQLNEIKEAVSRENSIHHERSSTESTKIEDDSPESGSTNDLRILNFKEACERSESRQALRDARSRARDLSSMIRLFVSDYSLLELSPTPYDEFIKLFGRNNYQQVASQTGENVVSESTETDVIRTTNKWTQFPVEYHRMEGKETDMAVYFSDRRGFGSDDLPRVTQYPSYDVRKLEKFVTSASEVMLIILEEEAADNYQMTSLADDTADLMEFSDGYSKIGLQNLQCLIDRAVTSVTFSPHNPNILVVCHNNDESDDGDQYYSRCILSIWNILRPALPEHMLVSPCNVSCCCFDNVNAQLFFAGLADGTISLWDLNERIHLHTQNLSNIDLPFILRSPTYCTCSKDQSDENHVSTVINVKSTGREFHHVDRFSNGTISSTELVSLSEDGKLLVWTVVNINEGTVNNDLCLAPWGKIKLALSASFNAFSHLPDRVVDCTECTCMSVNRADWPSALVGTSASVVLNCSPYGAKAKIPRFGQIDTFNAVTCVDFHPVDTSLFLVAYYDGVTKLYSTNKDHPLISFVKQDVHSSPIRLVKWSPIKAGLFVILDECSLQLWDLCKADLAPQFTARVNVDNKCLDLSGNVKFPYMAFVVDKTSVRVHRLKTHLTPGDLKTVNYELKLLKMYASKFT